MKVGIFGGTFDPVHYGHIALAKCAYEQAGLDKLFFVPAKLQPFKQGQKQASEIDRIEMLKLALDEMPDDFNIEISDIELIRGGISYTIDTLREFKKVFPNDKIHFILGSDAFLKMDKWKSQEEVFKEYSIIVGIRPGDNRAELDAYILNKQNAYNADIISLINPQIDLSSTMLRHSDPTKYSLPAVERYIKEHGLYQDIY